jgi:transcriptional regulator with XRE-family HTH domain
MKETTTQAGTDIAKSTFRGTNTPSLFIPAEPPLPDSERGLDESQVNIRSVLAHYEIGRKLRTLRLKKKIALVDLGKHTGLSASMLSQLENGKLVPTLPTLARIAIVFDVGLDHFFEGHPHRKRFSLVRAADQAVTPPTPESKPEGHSPLFAAPDKSLHAYFAEFPHGEEDGPLKHSHEGSKFLHVLNGSIAVQYQGEDYLLNSGDSAYFDGSEPHSYRATVPTATRALVIVTPPRI